MDIQELVKQTIENVKAVAETESVVGKPIINGDGTVILPVSKLSFGFVAGGGEYGAALDKKNEGEYPAARASGAGVTVTPIGFLICGREKKFITVDKTGSDNKWMDLARAAFNVLKDEKDDD